MVYPKVAPTCPTFATLKSLRSYAEPPSQVCPPGHKGCDSRKCDTSLVFGGAPTNYIAD